MKLASTRNVKKTVDFQEAVLRCLPEDGGLYQPVSEADLRPWILYMDQNTSFSSIAGTLTSALLKDELSTVICERLAGTAFSGVSPELRELEKDLFLLELFHGPTGCHKDYGALWLASALEHILTMNGKNAVVLAAVNAITGRSLANAFAGKKHLSLVLVYPEGAAAGLETSWFVWEGGNILPVEISGSLTDARNLVRETYRNKNLLEKHSLTLANTANIGRLLPQIFFYMFAFSRLRKKIQGDIFYSVPSGNYANLVAGLYAWKYSLPVNAFITDATPSLCCDAAGNSVCLDAMIPPSKRSGADPAAPSNIERLEQVFALNPLLLKGFVFPSKVEEADIPAVQFEARKKYGVWLNADTSKAFAAAKEFRARQDTAGAVVVFSTNHPAFEAENLRVTCGDSPETPESVLKAKEPLVGKKIAADDLRAMETLLNDFLPV